MRNNYPALAAGKQPVRRDREAMNSDITFEAAKQRVVRAIEKHGRINNRDLARKSNVYGAQLTRALHEIDDLSRLPTAKELAEIRDHYHMEDVKHTIKKSIIIAKEAARNGKSSVEVELDGHTHREIETMMRFFCSQGFKTKLNDFASVLLEW